MENLQRYVRACPDPDQLAAMPLEWFQLYNRVVKPTITSVNTLWHRNCYQHTMYHLTCADFELLLVRAKYSCERCGKAKDYLGIDHDHARGDDAVRGILCPKCNTHLKFVDADEKPCDELTAEYLAKPYERQHPFPMVPCFSVAQLQRRRQLVVRLARDEIAWRKEQARREARRRARQAAKRRQQWPTDQHHSPGRVPP